MVMRSENVISRLMPEGNSVYYGFTLFKPNFPANFFHCYEVCVCVNPSWQRDFQAKGLYMRGTREVREAQAFSFLQESGVHSIVTFPIQHSIICLSNIITL